MLALLSTLSSLTGIGCLLQHVNLMIHHIYKAEKSNTSAKGFLGIPKKSRSDCTHIAFLVQSFGETLRYCDEWRKFTSVIE